MKGWKVHRSRIDIKTNTYNEAKKPLEEVIIQVEENGISINIPALNKHFASSRKMLLYKKPPSQNIKGTFALGAKEGWLHRADCCLEDFNWLLSLEHYRFWSQLMYEQGSMDGLVSFLQEGYPYYFMDLLPDDEEIMQLYHELSRLVFLIIGRIMTRVESDYEYISERTYAKLLYNNFVVSVPMLVDLVSLYGRSNRGQVREILDMVFTTQPCYRDDFSKTVTNIKSAMRSVSEKFSSRVNDSGDVTRLQDGLRRERLLCSVEFLDDTLLYLLDLSVSLALFADLSPITASILHSHNFEITISQFYTQTLPEIATQIKKACTEEYLASYFTLVLRLNQTRYHLIKLFHVCFTGSLDNIISQPKLTDESRLALDSDLNLLNECLNDKLFVSDYHAMHPIDKQLNSLSSLTLEIDSVKVKYLIDAVSASVGIRPPATGSAGPSSDGRSTSRTSRHDSPLNSQMESRSGTLSSSTPGPSTSCQTGDSRGAQDLNDMYPLLERSSVVAPTPGPSSYSQTRDSGGIQELKDIFPHLGDGFLQKCLEYYNSTSGALNAILENSLPEQLACLDPELPLIPKELQFHTRPLPNRVNKFDNDEFDIMTQDFINPSQVYRDKKKSPYANLSEMLDDKCHINEMRDTYSRLGNIIVEEDANYDDEYDDSYDSVPVPVDEIGDDLTARRAFETPRVLAPRWSRGEKQEEEEEEEEEEEPGVPRANGFVPFVENPEDTRARWAAKRGGHAPQRNYTGKPKGQGQEDQVLINRHKKGVNKSSQANHNRRKLANRKRGGFV